jgi:hypothetical protein
MVTLAEDLYLLACDEATGRARISTAYLDLGLGGALLLDLVLRGRVGLVDEHVVVTDPTPVGDPLLDHALSAVAGDAKPREPEYWVRHLARGAHAAVQSRLVAAGVLAVEDHRVLGIIPVHHVHEIDDRIERDLLRQLYDAVVLGRPASRETAAVASLALAIRLERHLFPRADRLAIRDRTREIAGSDWVGPAVAHAINTVDAALGIPAAPDPSLP